MYFGNLLDSMIVTWGPPKQERALNSSSSGLIILPEILSVKGKLMGLIFDATKEGFFEFKVS